MLDERRDELTVDEILRLKVDDKLSDDLVDEVVLEIERVDVLTADVNEVAGQYVDVVGVNLSGVVEDVSVFSSADDKLLVDTDVAEYEKVSVVDVIDVLKDVGVTRMNGIDNENDECDEIRRMMFRLKMLMLDMSVLMLWSFFLKMLIED